MNRKYEQLLVCLVLAISFLVILTGCGGGGADSEEPYIEQTASKILETQDLGRQYFDQLQSQNDPNALQTTVDYLRSQPNVDDAGIGEDGTTIWIKYKSGVEGDIVTESFKSLGDSALSTSSYRVNRQKLQLFDVNRMNALSTSANKKAIILLPIDSVDKYKDTSVETLSASLQQSGYSVEIYSDEEVTVDLMKTLSNYNFVYMTTHGGVGIQDIGWNTAVMTGEIANADSIFFMWNYLKAGAVSGLKIMSLPKSEEVRFSLNKNFFDDYTYPSTFVLMNACSSFKNDSLAKAFLDNGASVFMGWDNVTSLAISNLFYPMFFQELAKPNNTLQQAFNTAFSARFPAVMYKDDNHNDWQHIKYLNGDESGDPDDQTVDYSLNLKKTGDAEFILNYQQSVGQISGSVKDAVTGSPLAGVTITVYQQSSTVTTGEANSSGTYSISVPAGSGYNINFSKSGYIPANYFNVTVEANTTTYLEAVLQIDTGCEGGCEVIP